MGSWPRWLIFPVLGAWEHRTVPPAGCVPIGHFHKHGLGSQPPGSLGTQVLRGGHPHSRASVGAKKDVGPAFRVVRALGLPSQRAPQAHREAPDRSHRPPARRDALQAAGPQETASQLVCLTLLKSSLLLNIWARRTFYNWAFKGAGLTQCLRSRSSVKLSMDSFQNPTEPASSEILNDECSARGRAHSLG